MLYAGSPGWTRPTRLAPEASPFFALAGGSLGDLSCVVTERPLNARLEGVGCAPCSRLTSIGSGAGMDRNRRENFAGLRGFVPSYKQSGACSTLEPAESVKCESIEWANHAMSEALDISQAALAIGGPGAFGGYTPGYFSLFAPLQDRAGRLISDYTVYASALPEDVKQRVHDAVRDANAGIKAVYDGAYEESTFRYLYDSLLRLPAFMYVTAASTGEDIRNHVGAAGEAIAGAFDFGKILVPVIAGVVLLGLYGRARG